MKLSFAAVCWCIFTLEQFEKPGRRADFDYPDMAKEAGTKALQDAGVSYSDVEQGVVGYVYGDTTCGQRAIYQLGMTGIPIYNVSCEPIECYNMNILPNPQSQAYTYVVIMQTA